MGTVRRGSSGHRGCHFRDLTMPIPEQQRWRKRRGEEREGRRGRKGKGEEGEWEEGKREEEGKGEERGGMRKLPTLN